MTSALATLLACAGQTVLYAQEPIIQTKYTADPAPMVYNDTVFLYTSHDEDDAQGYGFKMLDWQLYTSTDMVNWTDHGPIASLKDFTWRKRDNGAWALQVVERNGKFYMYCPLHGNGIGVLVSDSPYGPFKDPIGKPLVWQKEHWDDIDPTVYIDDDGQAYMYWGNPNLYYVKLNEDMTPGEEFKIDVKPVYFKRMHYKVKKLTGFDRERLAAGVSFPEALAQFRAWCGDDVTFLTWGCDDQGILEQNIIIHDLDWDWIAGWVNLQLIYNLQTDGDRNQKSRWSTSPSSRRASRTTRSAMRTTQPSCART